MAAQRYNYKPLNQGNKSIRLLSLLPGQFDDDLDITLWECALHVDDPPEYEALSYAWGDATKSCTVFVESQEIADPFPGSPTVSGRSRLAITYNLDETLRYLRYQDKHRVLWIDAVCINQSNGRERGQQVQKMADIFRLASCVVFWLGPEANNSGVALKTLCDIGSEIQIDYTTHKVFTSDEPESHLFCPEAIRKSLRQSSTTDLLEALFDRLYFERLWIRQEVHFGRDSGIVLCGHDEGPWRLFEKGSFCWSWYGHWSTRSALIHNVCARRNESLCRLLSSARRAACSDARDKVYAVLGMFAAREDSIAASIRPDYSKSVSQV